MNRDESGQLMIIVALGMVAFIGFAAITVDLGNGYSQRRLAQNGADAAATAAVRMVRMDTGYTTATDVYNEIVRVAALNGASQVTSAEFLDTSRNSLGDVQSYGGSLGNVAAVRVRTHRTYDTFFAGVVGMPILTSTGRATAMSLEIGSLSGTGLFPVALRKRYEDLTTADNPYTIWDDAMEAAGNAGWLDFNGGANSAAELRDWVSDGFASSTSNPFFYYENDPVRDLNGSPGASNTGPSLPIADFCWVQGSTGVVSSLHSAASSRVGDIVWIMLFNQLIDPGANARYQIVAMAPFRITNVNLHGGSKRIQGDFIDDPTVLPGDAGSIPTTGEISTVRLVAD